MTRRRKRPLAERLVSLVVLFGTLFSIAGAADKEMKMQNTMEQGFVEIENPKELGVRRIPVERVYVGKYYKPNIARLPNDELRIVGMACEPDHNFYGKNEHPIFRSTDGGRTWSKLAAMEVARGEPYLVTLRDGTMLATGGSSTPDGTCFLHRSEDGGLTWTSPPTAIPPAGTSWIHTRNVLELPDGSLLAGISEHVVNGRTVIWRSFDGGRTWSEKYPASFADVPEGYPYTILGETYLWQARSGKIFAILRVGFLNSWPLPGTTDPGVNDHSERMVVYSTTDIGRTWQKVGDMGWYGEYYPSILRLSDGRLLLTFTMREPFEPNVFPHGLRAVVGRETDDGFEFDLRHDRIMLDTKGPHARYPVSWSGSIGGTVQVDDGPLISVYAYGGYPDGDSKRNIDFDAEVIRWRLPESGK
ncbi:MAG: sialidase family protein [Planctomycetota bacterium]